MRPLGTEWGVQTCRRRLKQNRCSNWFGWGVWLGCSMDACGGISCMSCWRETPGRCGAHWRSYISHVAWECLGNSQEELAKVGRERSFCFSQLKATVQSLLQVRPTCHFKSVGCHCQHINVSKYWYRDTMSNFQPGLHHHGVNDWWSTISPAARGEAEHRSFAHTPHSTVTQT